MTQSNNGHTNGGLCALSVDRLPDDPLRPTPALRGPLAFRGLAEFGAIPELAWYFSASAAEVGFSSNFESMVRQIEFGGTPAGGAPPGPDDRARAAAELQILVRTRLRRLTPRLQAILELAYTDRRYTTADVTIYGVGIVGLVARARAERDAMSASPRGEAILRLQQLLMALSGSKKGKIPEWSPLGLESDGAPMKLSKRVKSAAEDLLKQAHDAYREAQGQTRQKRRRKRKPRREKLYEVAGTVGRAKRQLVEVARVSE